MPDNEKPRRSIRDNNSIRENKNPNVSSNTQTPPPPGKK